MLTGLLNKLSVRHRIRAIVAIVIGGIILGGGMDILMLRETLRNEKEVKTRQLVEAGFGVLNHFHDLEQKGELSEAAAKAAAMGTLRAMRYDGTDYFWLNDLGTPVPRMVMHPTMPDLDGKLMDDKKFNCATSLRVGNDGPFQATDGKMNLFAAFVQVVNRGEQGYGTYDWPKPLVGGGATAEAYPKLSYVRKFAPWGWLIGSGIYIDDIDRLMRERALRHLSWIAGIGFILLLLASAIARSITRPLRSTIALMDEIGGSEQGLALRLPVAGPSEFARLAHGFNAMLERIQARDAELERHQAELEDEVARRTVSLSEMNLQLEQKLIERKVAELALHDSNERFRSISSTAQDAILMIADDGTIAYWNESAERIFGYRQDEALGQDLHDLVTPERYRSAFRKGFERFRGSGEGAAIGKTLELAGLRRDGSEFPIELSLSAIRLGEAWFAVGFVRDISERKRAEQEISESRARMDALVNASGETMLLLDPEGDILSINASGAERFHKRPDELVGLNFFSLLPPDLAETRRTIMQQAILNGVPLHSQDRRGNIFFDNSLYPVKDETGTVTSVAVYAEDVTEQRRTEQVEEIFRNLHGMILKWHMDVASLAQMFCDEILPVFGLAAAWIGRAEKDGRLVLLAGTESMGREFLENMAENRLRWDGESAACPSAGGVIRGGYAQKASLDACQSCGMGGRPEGARETLALPLTLGGETWGVLVLYSADGHQFDSSQLSLKLSMIAHRLGMSLDAALQQEWLSLLDSALAGVGNAVMITDQDSHILWANRALVTLSGYATEEILGKTPNLFSSGAQNAEFFRRFWETLQAGQTWQGDIVNARRDGSRYTAHQTVTPLFGGDGQIAHFIAVLEDVTERKALEALVQHEANFDRLTDLPNRGLFFDRLEQAMAVARRDNLRGALLFIDLDHFKEINDRFGHGAGDILLITVAHRLRDQVRESDTVARLAGDEFTVILPHLQQTDDACRVAEKILAAISLPMDIGGHETSIGASIGVALFPDHGATVEEIVHAADCAMYEAKGKGRNSVHLQGTPV
jgi:diguanylate cyclase (GGDEF)-like protein/PAS domain S-box-containing protein